MDLKDTRSRQYVNLRTAATVAYIRLVGKSPDARDSVRLQGVLNEVAHALSAVAPIRTCSVEGTLPQELEPLDVIEGPVSRPTLEAVGLTLG
jgi:hypothetical protein